MILAPPKASAAPATWDWKDAKGPGTGAAYDVAYDVTRDICYMASGTNGLWTHKADGWKKMDAPVKDVRNLAYDAARNILYLDDEARVLRCLTPDSSPSYRQMRDFEYADPELVYDDLHNVLYVGCGEVYVCHNPDTAFRWKDTGSAGIRVQSLAYDPIHDVLYGGLWDGCSRCDNPRTNPVWTAIDSSIRVITSIAYDEDHDTLFLGSMGYYDDTSGIYRITNPRTSPSSKRISDETYFRVTRDSNNDRVYAAGRGVARCEGHETPSPTWVDLGGGLSVDKSSSLVFNTSANKLIAGFEHMGVHICSAPEAAPTWTDTGYAFGASGMRFAYDSQRDLLYASGWSVWRCEHPGSAPTWTNISANIANKAISHGGIAYDGTHNVLYVGSAGDYTSEGSEGVWRTGNPDRVASWTKMRGVSFGELIYDSEHDTLYGICDVDVMRCAHPSATSNWETIYTSYNMCGTPVEDIALDARRNILYIADMYSVVIGYERLGPIYSHDSETLKVELPQDEAIISKQYDGAGATLAIDERRGIVYAESYGGILGAEGYHPTDYCVDEARDVMYGCGSGVWRCANPGENRTWAATGGQIATTAIARIMYERNHDIVYVSSSIGTWYATPIPIPAVSSVDPAYGYPGQRLTVGIKGIETHFVQGQSRLIISSADIQVHSTRVISPTAAVADISIDERAKQQVAPLTVITGGEEAYPVYGGFSVYSRYSFAEGTCRPGFDTYICLSGRGQARVDLFTGSGERKSTGTIDVSGRTTVNCADLLGRGDDAAHDFSIAAYALDDEPLVVERSMYFDYKGITGGDAVTAMTPASTFYFAEGTCRPGFDPYICLFNPSGQKTDVKLTYMKGDGSTVDQIVSVAPGTRSTVRVKDTLGEADDSAHDFSTKVEALGGGAVVAERPMYFNYKGVWTGGSCVGGATQPEETLWFAEGCCRPNFDPYVTILNPGDQDAAVKVTYLRQLGDPASQEVLVRAHSRSTLHCSDVLGCADDAAHDFSIKVECTNGQKIVAERPEYFDYHGWTGGHDVMGTATPVQNVEFAEGTARPGFETYVSILNPNDEAVRIDAFYHRGGSDGYVYAYLQVPANSRATLRPSDVIGVGDDASHDFSISVSCYFGGIVVERPMYFDYKGWTGGSDVIGVETQPR